MSDPFSQHADHVSAPASRVFAVVPHDANALPVVAKALYVGTGGTVTLRCIGDSGDTSFANVPSGSILPVRARFVRAAGTTATHIVALA